MKKILLTLSFIIILISSLVVVAYAQEATDEVVTAQTTEEVITATVESTLEPTAEVTTEPTVEATVEPTTEPTVEATVEPTTEPTVEATVEPTTEPTVEATVEPTTEPTVEATVEPTTEPTVEATVEPTAEPTVLGAQGDIESQATYNGTWSSNLVVQNLSTIRANFSIAWYKNGAISPCDTTSSQTLEAKASKSYSPPTTGTCGTSWMGSAVVQSDQSMAAAVETIGSSGNLLSEYQGGTEPSTEPLIIPGPIFSGNGVGWDPTLIGISNAGSQNTVARVTLVNKNGTTHASKDVTIPAQSGVQLDLQDDVKGTPGDFTGSIRVENAPSGTNQPLYAVVKLERFYGGGLPVTTSFESFRATSDASSEWIVTLANRSVVPNTTTAYGLNTQISVVNPSQVLTTDVTVKWYNSNGTLALTTSFPNVAPGETVNPFTGLYTQLVDRIQGDKQTWGGLAIVEAVVDDTTTPHPVIALVQPVYKYSTFFNAWGSFKPFIRSQAGNIVNIPNARRSFNNSARVGLGWCTVINVGNLDPSNSISFSMEILNENGTQAFHTDSAGGDITLGVNGSYNFNTCNISALNANGGVFNGSAVIRLESGTGPLGALAQHTLTGWPSTGDPFAYYNPIFSDQ